MKVEIRDFGNWRAPRGTHRGRGLLLMEGLTDDVEVVRSDEGTTVELSRRIGVGAPHEHRANAQVDYVDSVGVVKLTGEVDIVAAQELRGRLLGAVRNEDTGLVVDLTDATYIDSVGVSLLFELAEKLTERQLRLAVVLPEGGLVGRVLGIVNLASVAEVHSSVDEALGAIRGG